MITKKSKKPLINFNDFWPWLTREAENRGLSKGEFMLMSRLSAQRYSEFAQDKRDISTKYFNKMIKGLGISMEEIPRKSGKSFTKAQKEELRLESWMQANREKFKIVMKHQSKWELFVTLLDSK